MFNEISRVSVATDTAGRTLIIVLGEDALGNEIASEFRTDTAGCGLWVWSQQRCCWQQIEGTSQFGAAPLSTLRRRKLAA